MSDDEDELIDLDEAWESPPMSPHERRLWGGGESAANSQISFYVLHELQLTTRSDSSGMSPGSSSGGSPHKGIYACNLRTSFGN